MKIQPFLLHCSALRRLSARSKAVGAFEVVGAFDVAGAFDVHFRASVAAGEDCKPFTHSLSTLSQAFIFRHFCKLCHQVKVSYFFKTNSVTEFATCHMLQRLMINGSH